MSDAVVSPLAFSPAAFYITVNLTGPASGVVPGQATTFQLVAPWGQTSQCYSWTEALHQCFDWNSRFTGRMGAFFLSGATNNLTTTSATVPVSANYLHQG